MVGTIVAGLLLQAFWWGSVQLVFGAVAVLLVVPAIALVAQNRSPQLLLDPLGALWSLIGLSGLVYGIIAAPERGWTDPVTLAAVGIGLLGLLAFGRHQLRSEHPSLDIRLFRSRGLATGSALVAVQFFASLGLFVLAPQYLQIVRDFSPLGSALALLIIPVGVGAGTGLAPVLLNRYGARVPGAGGLATMAAGFGVLGWGLSGGVEASWWPLVVGLVLFGLGFGLGVTPGTVLILEGLPPERRSVASAVNDITREVGGVLGIAVLSSVLVARYRDSVAASLTGLPDPLQTAVNDGAGTGLGAAGSLGPDGAALTAAVRLAFSEGVSQAMWVGGAVLAATAALCAVLGPRGQPAVSSAPVEEEVLDAR